MSEQLANNILAELILQAAIDSGIPSDRIDVKQFEKGEYEVWSNEFELHIMMARITDDNKVEVSIDPDTEDKSLPLADPDILRHLTEIMRNEFDRMCKLYRAKKPATQ